MDPIRPATPEDPEARRPDPPTGERPGRVWPLVVLAAILLAFGGALALVSRIETGPAGVRITPSPTLSPSPVRPVPCPSGSQDCGGEFVVVVTVYVPVPTPVEREENALATTWIPLGSMVAGLVSALTAAATLVLARRDARDRAARKAPTRRTKRPRRRRTG